MQEKCSNRSDNAGQCRKNCCHLPLTMQQPSLSWMAMPSTPWSLKVKAKKLNEVKDIKLNGDRMIARIPTCRPSCDNCHVRNGGKKLKTCAFSQWMKQMVLSMLSNYKSIIWTVRLLPYPFKMFSRYFLASWKDNRHQVKCKKYYPMTGNR